MAEVLPLILQTQLTHHQSAVSAPRRALFDAGSDCPGHSLPGSSNVVPFWAPESIAVLRTYTKPKRELH